MATLEYYSEGHVQKLSVRPLARVATRAPTARASLPAKTSAAALAPQAMRSLHDQAPRLAPLYQSLSETTVQAVAPTKDSLVILTETLVLDGARKADVNALKKKYGLEVVREGSDGKYLLRAPAGGKQGVEQAFEAARYAYKHSRAEAAHPNFLRVLRRARPSVAGNQALWNYNNSGHPGVPGADVAAHAAWTITRGRPEVRVAVLDEGVDTAHGALKGALVAERDFVDANATARPDGDDAHGTACAGIIVSRDGKTPGIAGACSLVAVRIAKGDGNDGWIFDDFNTADAIDWAWRDAKADVLSNSWGGGPPADVITRAIQRARTRGRNGKGAVVVFAAGNENGAVSYPGTLSDVLTVGASNQWDERKTPKSKDGETWWGSNSGPSLDLVAPGVAIATTDIGGTRGYSRTDFTRTFNGTSSATPHVAAGAALILSEVPSRSEGEVRDLLKASVDRINASGKWDRYVGHGRLNLFSALRMARR
jgi:subtilisin family serine protease